MSGPSEAHFAPIGFDVERLYQGNIAAAGTEALTGRPTLFLQQAMPDVCCRQWRRWRRHWRGGR